MIWTLDMDDFRGQFCCQGKFPLIRTIKAVLHGQLKLLPKEKICSACPTKEYKGRTERTIELAAELCRRLPINEDFKPQTTEKTTEKTTKKPKKSKRDADAPSAYRSMEECLAIP